MSFFHTVVSSSLNDFTRACQESRSLEIRLMYIKRLDGAIANLVAHTHRVALTKRTE